MKETVSCDVSYISTIGVGLTEDMPPAAECMGEGWICVDSCDGYASDGRSWVPHHGLIALAREVQL